MAFGQTGMGIFQRSLGDAQGYGMPWPLAKGWN